MKTIAAISLSGEGLMFGIYETVFLGSTKIFRAIEMGGITVPFGVMSVVRNPPFFFSFYPFIRLSVLHRHPSNHRTNDSPMVDR